MNLGSMGFDGLAERRDDPSLLAWWVLSTSLVEHWPALRGMAFVCALCEAVAHLPDVPTEGGTDLREGMACPHCGMSARLRSSLTMLATLVDIDDRIYVTEQATSLFAWLQARYPLVRGSEFQPDEARRAKMGDYLESIGGHGVIEFEDVTRLSMADASLDAVACFDVLEHVPDYAAAIGEFKRALRPGGKLIATFPFTDAAATLIRASLASDGDVVHHMEPEYHGDPIGEPVLCFQHFGWDLLDVVREAGFSHASMVMPWAPEHGILYGHWTLVATR